MFVFVVRHAWAGHFGDPGWPDDSLRELDPEGAERFAKVVKTLAPRGFAPEIVATSPYTRCRQTADIVAMHTTRSPEVVELPALAPSSDFEKVAQWTQETEANSICWVGHAPDVGILTAALIGSTRANIRFAKGTVAAIRLRADCEFNGGQLYWLATAKSLGI